MDEDQIAAAQDRADAEHARYDDEQAEQEAYDQEPCPGCDCICPTCTCLLYCDSCECG